MTSRSGSSNIDFNQWPDLKDERNQLYKKGYKDKEALAYMLDTLSKSDKAEQKRLMDIWLSRPSDEGAKKMAEYKQRWRDQQAKAGAAASSPEALEKIKMQLQEKGYGDPNAVLYMMKRLADDPGKAAAELKKWLAGDEQTTRRSQREYATRWKNEHPDQVVSGGSSGSGPTVAPSETMMNLGQLKQDLAPMFPDPVVRDGMIEMYRSYGDIKSANKLVQEWKTNVAKRAEFETSYRIMGQRAKRWRKDLGWDMAVHIPMPVDETMESLNQRLLAGKLYYGPSDRYGFLWHVWRLPASVKEEKLEDWLMADDATESLAGDGSTQNGKALYHSLASLRSQKYTQIWQQVRTLYNDQAGTDHLLAQSPGERFGTAISRKAISDLQGHKYWGHLTISDRSAVLEVLSRPRTIRQEDALVALLQHKGIKLVIDAASEARPPKDKQLLHPGIVTFARLVLRISQQEELAALFDKVEHSAAEMKQVGQILRGIGLRPFKIIPLMVEGVDNDAGDCRGFESADYQLEFTSKIRRNLGAGPDADSLVDSMLCVQGHEYHPGSHMEQAWMKVMTIAHECSVLGAAGASQYMTEEFGDPDMLLQYKARGASQDELDELVARAIRARQAGGVHYIRTLCAQYYGPHIADAIMVDLIEQMSRLGRVGFDWRRPIKIAEAAKKEGAKQHDIEAFNHYARTYEARASHAGYYAEREKDTEPGSLYNQVRAKVLLLDKALLEKQMQGAPT